MNERGVLGMQSGAGNAGLGVEKGRTAAIILAMAA